jgi:ferric-dicitrate binding protein FerR (iron transport regulator)
MSRKSTAQELVRAAAGGAGPVSPDVSALLEAVAVLKAADGGHVAPDPAFAASLRQRLIEEHPSAVAAPVKAEERSRRRIWPTVAVGATALAAIALAAILFFVVSPAGPTVARLTVQNGAVQVTSQGRTRPVTASTDKKNGDVKAGDTVATFSGSRATLSFLNKDVTRLEAASTMKVDSYDSRDVGLVLKSGKAYCRVVRHGDFTVSCNGVEVTATGTAFGVDSHDGVVDSPVFEGTVKVVWPTGSRSVSQGKQLTLTKKNGRYVPTMKDIDPTADLSWLAFNRDLDKRLKLPLGILGALGATPPNGNLPPGTPPAQQSSSPGSSKPSDSRGRQSSPGPVASSPTATNPQPGPQPTPQPNPTPEPTPGPGPQVTPSVSLSVASAGPPVVVSWSVQNGESVTGVAVLKGAGVMDPSYPGNSVLTTSPATSSYRDKDVESGGTYSYRIALLSDSTPPPQLSLDGKGQGTSVYISWSLSGVVHIDSWAVLRSGNNPSPSFPTDQYATVGYSGPSGSFSDSNASPNRDYYRVAGLYQGRVIVKSNTVLLP